MENIKLSESEINLIKLKREQDELVAKEKAIKIQIENEKNIVKEKATIEQFKSITLTEQ